MMKSNRLAVAALLIGLVGGQTLWAGWSLLSEGLHERDAKRLEAARKNHVSDIERAFSVYTKQVDRANETLARIYEQVIRQYDNRGEDDVVASLKAELEELKGESMTLACPEPEDDEKESAKAPGHEQLIRWIGPQIVNAQNQRAQTSRLADNDYVLLYYTAGWCGPCRAFTPQLIDFYNENRSLGKWEIVVVSGDRSESAFFEYLQSANMPWAAVPYERLEPSGLVQRHPGGWPRMVVYDRQGKVVMSGHQEMIHQFRTLLLSRR